MNDILKFIEQIPYFIKAKEPEQLKFFLVQAYEAEKNGTTKAFDRSTDRFLIIKKYPVRNIVGWLNKMHLLWILYIVNETHKEHTLPAKNKARMTKKLNTMAKIVDIRKTNLSINGASARSTKYWI